MSAVGELTWLNVGAALSLVLVDVGLSKAFDLGVATSLLIASVRCVVQLSFTGILLQAVFLSESPLATALTIFTMLLLAGNEVAMSRIKRKPKYLLTYSAISMIVTIGPVAAYGSRFAMRNNPFWSPESFIPMIGMITGNTLSAVAYDYAFYLVVKKIGSRLMGSIGLNHVMKAVTEEKDKIELFISYGATRTEACIPLVRDALNVALLPVINQMAVIGLISIPGMMTGALMAGAPVDQAAKMQMSIMFLITGCSALCTFLVIVVTLWWMIDDQHRTRLDRLDKSAAWLTILQGRMLQILVSLKDRFIARDRTQYVQLSPVA